MNAPDLTREKLLRRETCAQHGEFEARLVHFGVWTRCQKCAEEAAAKEQVVREERERERAMELWEKRLAHAGIPERFKDRSLESYVAKSEGHRRALAFAKAYAEGFDDVRTTGRSAVFIGKPGTGKTHLAIAIGLKVMQRGGRTVIFSKVMKAILQIRSTWRRNADVSEVEATAAFTDPDLLILDEVGIQYGSDAEKLLIFQVINERYEQRRPTLLVSNLGLDEVRSYLGERVYDRLREDGGEVVVFDWTSYRGEHATKGGG